MGTAHGEGAPAADAPPELTSHLASIALAEMCAWSRYFDWSQRLQDLGVLSSESLINAFHDVSRWDFLPENRKDFAGFDIHLEIGYGQTNSQPKVVARMLELLEPQIGDNVLDFGAGSAWTTALLAHAVTEQGSVTGTEVVPELVAFGNENLAKYNFPHARVLHTASDLGHRESAPYNRILASARLPEAWLGHLTSQLDPQGGKLVVPVSRTMEEFHAGGPTQDIVVITRFGDEMTHEIARRGVGFKPTVWSQPEH